MATEYKGSLAPKKKAELEEIADAMEIDTTSLNKPELIAAIRTQMELNEPRFSQDPQFKRLYTKIGPGRPSNAQRASSPGQAYSPAPTSAKRQSGSSARAISSSMSPEDNDDEEDVSSPSGQASHSFTSGGIPKGRELPRSPIKQVTDHLPALSVPGSVKKLAKSIFAAKPSELLARPAEVVDEVIEHGEEVIQAQAGRVADRTRGAVHGAQDKAYDVVHGAQERANDVVHGVQERAQDVVHGVQQKAHEAEEGVVVAIDQAEVLITKAKNVFQDKIWAPSGRYFSTQSNQTLLLITLESILLLSRTLLFRTIQLTFPPTHPALHPTSGAATPIAGEYNIDHPNSPPPHVLRNQNSLHPWVALNVRVPDWQTSFKGWDATQRLYLPLFVWAAVTLALPAILSALIGSKGNAGGRTLVFHILRLGVWGALACQAGGVGGLVVESLRGTGLDTGLGIVGAGVGVLMGFARALGDKQ